LTLKNQEKLIHWFLKVRTEFLNFFVALQPAVGPINAIRYGSANKDLPKSPGIKSC
jgi:hypothetical protein